MSPPYERPPSPLRRLDAGLYAAEQALVTLAAAVMVITVTLDILARALRGAQTEPALSALSLFGLLPSQLPAGVTPTGALLPPLLAALAAFGFGWGAVASRRRAARGAAGAGAGEGAGSDRAAALKAGALSLALTYALCVAVYQAPSWVVCSALALLGLGAAAWGAWREGRPAAAGGLAALALVTAWLASRLPQDYIWSQELSLILLAWVAFLGGSMATYQHKHIEISALGKLVPPRARPLVRPAGLLATALFSGYVALLMGVGAFGPTGSLASGEVRPATGVPSWVILFAGVVSFGLIALRSLAYSLAAFRDPQALPEKENTH